MNHALYNYISSAIVFGIWICLAVIGIREYVRILKTPGEKAIQRWKRIGLRLFILWVITAILVLAVSMIIDRTIGFRE